jgi:hypothetical protein
MYLTVPKLEQQIPVNVTKAPIPKLGSVETHG